MAKLCLRLPIFIASSSELQPEREVAEAQILALAGDAAQHNLLLDPFRWEKHTGLFPGPFQPTLNEPLRDAEMAIVLFWTKLGDGTREEYERSLAQSQRGETDNVSIYFKLLPDGNPIETRTPVDPKLKALHRDIEERQLARVDKFESTKEFAGKFATSFRLWLRRWHGVAFCCQYALENSSPTTRFTPATDRVADRRRNMFLPLLDPALDYLGGAAVDAYQQDGMENAVHRPLSRNQLTALAPNWVRAADPAPPPDFEYWWRYKQPVQPTPLRVDSKGAVYIADYEWFCYFAAVGLASAIQTGRWQVAARRQYLNDIHQYLKGHVQHEKQNLLPTLRCWLTNAAGAPAGQPVVRDFSAYVLGMLGDFDSQTALYETFKRDESEAVKRYCLTSLGKLRARRYVPDLVRLFFAEPDSNRRRLLSQVICTIVGIAYFPL